MDANLLPQVKALLLRSIKSCITEEQLHIAGNMIDLFRVGFANVLDKEEMNLHQSDLIDAWTLAAENLCVNTLIPRTLPTESGR